ncbi:MAG TPA: ATP-binding cassette domain-containing protein [Vicinamibacterales bacterium]|nr:ATP-binding cassette domain-containing protein [Vicinamibacterales bacterium]
MTAAAPVVEMQGVEKPYGGLRPLRIRAFQFQAGDRVWLTGLDAAAAETFVNLTTGASVPETGAVRVDGQDTREIATDTEWLASLDRFGIVTHRAVLVDGLSIAANLALPLTLSVDPMSDVTRAAVLALAREVDLPETRLAAAAATLTPVERVRVDLARGLAHGPRVLLLEHPTVRLAGDADASRQVGECLREVARRRNLGWLALSEDRAFMEAAGGTQLELRPATGDLVESNRRRWWKRG